ncbi:MAG: retention module-containing protein, partial [Gammaproteobacteria bacterium]
MVKFGIVKFVMGVVKAISVDGTERILHTGDRVLPNETIVTGENGNVIIAFNTGETLDLGRNQLVALDADVLVPENPAVESSIRTFEGTRGEVAAIQRALFDENFDPTKVLKPTAAGAGAGGGTAAVGNEGHSHIYVVDYLNPISQPDSGFATIGPSVAFPQMEEPLIQAGTATLSVTAAIDIGGRLPPPGDNGIILIPGGTTVPLGATGAQVIEGSDGVAHAVTFVISLSQTSATDVTVTYTIVPITASNPEDYFDGAQTGTVTIPAGFIGFAITEMIMADTLIEGNETFKIVLSNVQGATLLNDTAIVTIIDDDVDAIDDFDSTN